MSSTSISSYRASSRGAFALIELLVVIAIIALLAAILFPVFARARENARKASCQYNLRQIGLGVMQYTQDYDERMPYNDYVNGNGGVSKFMDPTSAPNTLHNIQPYVKSIQIYVCPSAYVYTGDPPDPATNSDTSYYENGVISNRALAAIPEVASTVMVQEGEGRAKVYYARPTSYYCGGSTYSFMQFFVPAEPTKSRYNNYHFDGGSLLFCDGHVKWRKATSIRASDFGLTPANTIPDITNQASCLAPAF